MRNTFAATLTELAAADPRVVMLSADIGNRLFDDFKSQFPDRFYNCGVAEADMIGIAAGLAMNGLRPIAYTITPFVTTRCLEQIRVDLCYHKQPVIVAGVGAGLGYAELGATHHACEDVAFLRALPEMTVVCPADTVELDLAMRAALALDGPCYLRMGKKGEPKVHATAPDFRLGRAIVLEEGDDACLLACGFILPVAAQAAKLLRARGISTRLVSFHTVKPLDTATLAHAFRHFGVVATIEEHSIVGGFGSAVAEWLVDQPTAPRARLLRIGTPDAFLHETAHHHEARELFGLTPDSIAHRVMQSLNLQKKIAS